MRKTVTLGQIANFSQGIQVLPSKQYPTKSKERVRFLRIVDYTKNDEPIRYIENPGDKYLIKNNELAMIRYGSQTAGKAVMGLDGSIANNIFKIIVHENINVKYLYYYLSQESIYRLLNGSQSSSTMPAITFGQMKNLKILLPIKELQDTIANFIELIDEKIELNRKMNETLEQMGQALFRHYFITNPEAEGWGSETVGSKYNVILGGTPSRAKQEYWVDGTIGWINSGKVNEFRIIEPSELITELALSKSAAKLLPKGTTVLAITGATLGQVSRIEKQFAANQSVIGVVPSSHFSNEFAYFWINHSINKIIRHQTGGAQQHINKSNVSSFELITPPLSELESFQKEVEPIMEKIALQCEEIQSLTNLRNSLLPGLISGVIKI